MDDKCIQNSDDEQYLLKLAINGPETNQIILQFLIVKNPKIPNQRLILTSCIKVKGDEDKMEHPPQILFNTLQNST